MASVDRRPLTDGPVAEHIQGLANNRLGAVYSALYNFWSARQAAVAAGQRAPSAQRRGQETAFTRRDSYSVILFDDRVKTALINDVRSSPDQLLNIVLRHKPGGGTNFARALRKAQDVMVKIWSTGRTPIMIFLSDGECTIPATTVQDLCHIATSLGRPLSFHSVSFSSDRSSAILQRMADIALQAQENACRSAGIPAAVSGPPSSFTNALDTVQLTETFLGIADSMRKPRGSLVH